MAHSLVLTLATFAAAVAADELEEEDAAFELDLPFPTLEAAAKAADSDAVLDLMQLGQSSRTPDFDVHYPNRDGFTPLYWSSWSGCSKCVDMMLQAGADVNQCGHDGASPLMAAASSNFSEVCAQLISAGADLHARRRTAKGEYSALDIARERRYYEVIDVLVAAIEQEAKQESKPVSKKKKKNHKNNKQRQKPKKRSNGG